MSRSLKTRHLLAAGILFSLIFYQNCAQAPDTSTASASTYQQMLPFAYQATIDTIAYMSCSDMADGTYEPRAYFSIRAGAYNPGTGGLSMTPAFFSATQYYSATDRGNTLANSDLNSNTLLNFSIRSASNYQGPWQTSSTGPGYNQDAFLPALDSAQIAGPFAALSNTSQKINYFPGTESQRLIEASLRFMATEDDANMTRNTLSSNASMLVVGYSATADVLDQNLRSPLDVTGQLSGQPYSTPPASESTANTVFGVGYTFSFAMPAGYSSGDKRVLSTAGIHEVDLTTGQYIPATWDCVGGTLGNYQFMIIRPEDVQSGAVGCAMLPDSYTNAAQLAALTAIRRVLRVEDWWVDLNNHCVVPKFSADYCYGSNLGTRTVTFGSANTTASCADTNTTVCPHFVSVCIRQ